MANAVVANPNVTALKVLEHRLAEVLFDWLNVNIPLNTNLSEFIVQSILAFSLQINLLICQYRLLLIRQLVFPGCHIFTNILLTSPLIICCEWGLISFVGYWPV